jgi:hypothetical protein
MVSWAKSGSTEAKSMAPDPWRKFSLLSRYPRAIRPACSLAYGKVVEITTKYQSTRLSGQGLTLGRCVIVTYRAESHASAEASAFSHKRAFLKN